MHIQIINKNRNLIKHFQLSLYLTTHTTQLFHQINSLASSLSTSVKSHNTHISTSESDVTHWSILLVCLPLSDNHYSKCNHNTTDTLSHELWQNPRSTFCPSWKTSIVLCCQSSRTLSWMNHQAGHVTHLSHLTDVPLSCQPITAAETGWFPHWQATVSQM